MLWTEMHMCSKCDSHVLLLSASFRETRWPGRFRPEQGTPAASVREVQSPGLLLPPRAIRRILRSSPPFSITSPIKRSKKKWQNINVNISNASNGFVYQQHATHLLCIMDNWICLGQYFYPYGTQWITSPLRPLIVCLQTLPSFSLPSELYGCAKH